MTTFVQKSLGRWRSQRSVHHLAFGHFEQVESELAIEPVAVDAPAVMALCEAWGVSPERAIAPFVMKWEGRSDWDGGQEVLAGECLLVPVPSQGKLLRDRGYAETLPAVGTFAFAPDGTFVLTTPYERAAAEERIWFVTDDVRYRVSSIRTSSGKGVVTASFSTEIRRLA
ncbi:MAG: phycobiliprotein lyase [Pseudanabaenaceae cyanobacterium]